MSSVQCGAEGGTGGNPTSCWPLHFSVSFHSSGQLSKHVLIVFLKISVTTWLRKDNILRYGRRTPSWCNC